MTGRLIIAIVTTVLQEAGIAMIVLLALPLADIILPIEALVAIMVAWAVVAFVIYRAGSRALIRKPLPLTDMKDTRGKVVSPLDPHGAVRIRGETWDAVSQDGRKINNGEVIVVIAQDSLRLTVRKADHVKK
ncbi:NfeD family protein [Chloroflexota bacterium]